MGQDFNFTSRVYLPVMLIKQELRNSGKLDHKESKKGKVQNSLNAYYVLGIGQQFLYALSPQHPHKINATFPLLYKSGG